MKTTYWYCDSCGGRIDAVEKGWVEWLSSNPEGDQPRSSRGFRLVHHGHANGDKSMRCQYVERVEWMRDKSTLNDLPFKDFLGSDGLMLLLSLISERSIPEAEGIEMIRRLHVPGYEEARKHFERAIAEDVINPSARDGYVTQSDIAAVLAFARKNP